MKTDMYDKLHIGTTVFILFYMSILVLVALGYTLNLIQLVVRDWSQVLDVEVGLKIIGVALVPIGAFMGWIGVY